MSGAEAIVNLQKMALKIGVTIAPDKLDLFAAYYRELLFWNRQINLVSERSAGEIVERHFVDSLTALCFCKSGNAALIDLGSGGGFPGIPLKIMRSDLKLYMVDSSRKKTSFLSHIVRTLDLRETTVLRGRIEDLLTMEELAGKFDMTISRAAFSLASLLHFSSVFLKPGGELLAMRGPEMREESSDIEAAAQKTGMRLVGNFTQDVTINHSSRKIIIYNLI